MTLFIITNGEKCKVFTRHKSKIIPLLSREKYIEGDGVNCEIVVSFFISSDD